MPATEAGDDAAVNRAAARSRRRIDQDRNRWTVEGRVKSRRRIHAPPVRSQRRRPSATAQAVRRGGIPRRRGPERRPQEVQEEEGKGGGGGDDEDYYLPQSPERRPSWDGGFERNELRRPAELASRTGPNLLSEMRSPSAATTRLSSRRRRERKGEADEVLKRKKGGGSGCRDFFHGHGDGRWHEAISLGVGGGVGGYGTGTASERRDQNGRMFR